MEAINWEELGSVESVCEERTFMKAIDIWLQKPHVVNRRLTGAVVLHKMHTDAANDQIARLIAQFSPCSRSTVAEGTPSSQNKKYAKEGCSDNCSSNRNARFELCVRKLIPRPCGHGVGEETINELIVIDHRERTATFVPLQDPPEETTSPAINDCKKIGLQTAYRIDFLSENSRIVLHISEGYREPASPASAVFWPTRAWLRDCLLPKVAKWAAEVSPDAAVRPSQALVSMERYSALYGQLKRKYGAKFVKIWPENTDPLKFVYEDVAIATYLIVLWEQEQAEKGLEKFQSFVDLGCGNGLLVHILNSEGYPGKGVDLRRRKIWDLYGPGTHLEECSITPSDEFLFSDSDWLIGNHSDELTPWIPVMAARSSFTTRYFVLPCCFHDFDAKFMRTEQTKTQYRAYLDFVAEVGRVCGFRVEEDSMRIPSTKRVCQVGSRRTYTSEQSAEMHQRITSYIESRRTHRTCQTHKKDLKRSHTAASSSSERSAGTDSDVDSTQTEVPRIADEAWPLPGGTDGGGEGSLPVPGPAGQWAPGFQPREKVEPVRNCAKVDYALKCRIVREVARAILEKGGVSLLDSLRGSEEKRPWRRGGSLSFAEIVKLFDGDTLKQLKAECGGLKTLLKNSHQVFQVSSNRVELRDCSQPVSDRRSQSKKPLKSSAERRSKSLKTTLCWFHSNHPDGCPRLAEDCQFAHGEGDLKN